MAAQQVWGKNLENLFFCEIDKYCQQVLKKNFGKEILIYDDIKKVNKEQFIKDYYNTNPDQHRLQEQRTEQQASGDRQFFKVDLLTAGPPCQPASAAGKRKGDKDDRWLWEEMFKIVSEFKPTWCIIENVYGLVSLEQGLVFDSLLAKMEALGYEIQPIVVGAVSKNAPHKRYRVWFIAHSIDSTNRTDRRTISKENGVQGINRKTLGGGVFTGAVVDAPNAISRGCESEREQGSVGAIQGRGQDFTMPPSEPSGDATDSKHEGHVRRGSTGNSNGDGFQESEQAGQEPRGATSRCSEDVGNPEGAGQPSGDNRQGQMQHGGTSESGFAGWDRDWFEVATEFCRMDDGISVRVDGLELTKSQHRVERLKALGNAVVVPLVVELLGFIKQAEENPMENKKEGKAIKFITISEDKNGNYFGIKDLRNWK